LRQFFLEMDEGASAEPGQTVALDQDESHHLFTVLRGGRDLVLNLTDGHGRRYTARSAGKQGRIAQVEILTVTADPSERAQPQLELSCAVVKGKRFEWALEKAVELGAHRITPLITEHGVIEPGSGRRQRWLTIMKSALKQCGRCWLPLLNEPIPLDEALRRSGGLTLFGAVPGEVPETRPWLSLLNPPPQPMAENLTMFIGPEGGWSAQELALLIGRGAVPVELGPHVMRTETAAVAGLAALQTLRRGWSIQEK
jgi:16S rRNA (uracil1498-N3)-methyltransferase